VVCLGLALACATAPREARFPASNALLEPLAAGLVALASGRADDASRLLSEAGERHPTLADYALYFRARAAASAGEPRDALAAIDRLLALDPDSIWAGPARLLAGELLRRGGDLGAARGWHAVARATLPSSSARWARATLVLAELEQQTGDPAAALDLARELRRARPRGIAARRARRLTDRIIRARPDLTADPVEEGEMRLKEGDAAGAVAAAEAALATDPEPPRRARALWTRAQAERAQGDHAASEATCLALAHTVDDPLAPRALVTAGGWRWNADDDAAALRLFREAVTRFPDSPQAAEALYAIGRVQQEAGRWADAYATYSRLAQRFPDASVAPEARWRASWVRYLAGDFAAAARSFARLRGRGREAERPAAEYWQARALERLGQKGEARTRLAHVLEHHPFTYYARLASERLGEPAPDHAPPEADRRPPFPADLAGPHAERARLLAELGLTRFARRELDALAGDDPPRRLLLQAYQAVGAPGAAIRLARAERGQSADPELYPLGFWHLIRPAAVAHGLDPLLVTALIRQESLFEPEAVSSANARGLMQLLPRTADTLRRSAGEPPLPLPALHDPSTNVGLGVTLFARLLTRYDGSAVKALAAYNAGEDAVAKWERRYGERETDEFVELISYRETRDYVKAVLRNQHIYRHLYARAPSAPSAAATNPGNPPKAPFDMMTMTSPGWLEPTR
jgi:soluble lytic murein transglycosylase